MLPVQLYFDVETTGMDGEVINASIHVNGFFNLLWNLTCY